MPRSESEGALLAMVRAGQLARQAMEEVEDAEAMVREALEEIEEKDRVVLEGGYAGLRYTTGIKDLLSTAAMLLESTIQDLESGD